MDKEISRQVSVIAERRPAVSRWADEVWRIVAVLDGKAAAEPLTQLGHEPDGTKRFFAGSTPLVLHRKETEAYRINLAGDRVLYAIMHPDDGDPPFVLHDVTASPHEAADHLDSGEELVEAVPMPAAIVDWLQAFCDFHQVDEPFKKRRRDKVDAEELKFSKEPIFART
ncbi:MAG: DUF3305 domain-containing protein, partial [Hyphomicrobiales bacterium]|nr:DUF3305 domain-containing protein [Hyphomicrobiales bacterium]